MIDTKKIYKKTDNKPNKHVLHVQEELYLYDAL